MNAGASLSGCKVAFYVVVAKFPVASIRFSADGAQRFEEFQQSNIFVAIAIEHWKTVIGGVGIDGNAFFFGRAKKKKRESEKDCGLNPKERPRGDGTPPRQPAG